MFKLHKVVNQKANIAIGHSFKNELDKKGAGLSLRHSSVVELFNFSASIIMKG